MKWAKRAATGAKQHHRWHRKPLALPYAIPPSRRSLVLDPALHTAAEIMQARQQHVA